MNKILSKRFFSDNVAELVVEAPLIARSRRAGHFVIIRVDALSERVPLTIAGADIEKGTITLVVQQVGASTHKLLALNAGDSIHDVVGPLGRATRIEKYGTVVCACGGVGAAPMLPIAEALKKAGNKVITVLAARNKDLLILRDELAQWSDEVIIMTDDGSAGQQGVVTVGVEEVINREPVNKCITIGPAIMMKFVALTTAKYNIPTEASLNTIMVDGTGMCGACRVTVGGKTKFVCVDGPEFDAHAVNWDEMLSRMKAFKAEETEAMEAYLNNPTPPCSTDDHWASDRAELFTRTREGEECTPNAPFSSLEGRPGGVSPFEGKPKDRVAIPRVQMPELRPEVRVKSLHEEVNQGLTFEQAITESHRCLNCPKPTCVQGCPVNINIPGFIKTLEKGDILGAAAIIKESSSLPAVCGRVCPQEKQCESQCIHLKMGHPAVAIGYLERFCADYANAQTNLTPTLPTREGASPLRGDGSGVTKIAVVGSGPAGLTFAGDAAKYGYEVHVFEALHEIGGVLKYGIPEFRLPNRIVDIEIDGLRALGVQFHTDTIIGKTISVEELEAQGFKGIFVGSGAGLPRFMNIPGENLNGVMSCNEYLTRVNLMDASNPATDTPLLYGKNVAVIGGGNTAMDAVRTAKRLGAEHAMIIYRRSEEEMPARIEEVHHAKQEGIEFLTLHNPIEYHADENGRVCEAVLQVMELGEPDESGRRSPVPVEGKTITIPVDLVIVAVGVSPNPLIPSSVEGLEISKKGTIVVNEGMQSAIPTLFAGGDIVRGGATVILAMSDGRKAAAAMHEYLEKV
ncbi:MAG: bifunctional dihydroorotate dehydrogenase B NAD binding subunit/NADPH-dependent glutamate synthase [Bacteroidales bacterium]|nr:bifunctional dihydroorotate dehydrogenase B NAD binding subunit/NADPH-dependent glutamate synthase [Bacteroidales bacterium]MDY6406106.1 bifunctional dihydroorotate dehydrogenase B NAD binding subunit/NADPH-dependent glutamate synthase [Bacteroidales bacterium]